MLVRRSRGRSQRGGSTVETAVALPIALMLTLGTCIVGLGIYRYQQVATLAREGARYASVHGNQFALDVNSGTLMTSANIYNNAIKPMASGMNLSNLSYQVQWGTMVGGSWAWTSWDSSTENPTSISNSSGQSLYNAVQVTVTYQWTPGMYISGTLNLSSTSVIPMSY
jgi:Flp pilus assembly protein TadG